MNSGKNFKINPCISYCVDSADIKILNKTTHTCFTLPYPQAAIWDFIIKGYSLPRIVKLTSAIAHIDQSHAITLVQDFMDYLIQREILIS